MTHRERIEMYLAEGRTVSGGKGSHSSAEQQAADQQRQMEDQIAQQQLNMFNQQLTSVNRTLNPIIAGGGMNQGQQSALTSLLLNDLPNQFKGLEGNINQQLVARGITGGNMAGSGDIARNFGQLGAMEAGLQQQGLSDIQLQKQQQLMQALGLKLGIGGQFGQSAGGFNQGAIGSLNAGVGAAGNADQASTSWMGPVFGALSSVGTAGIGKV